MISIETAVVGSYFFVLSLLAVYGLHRYFLLYLYMKHRNRVPVPSGSSDPLPFVTIQLPIFNEMYVVNRLIDAVCEIDYPRELLEIQVLDDSTDNTQEIAKAAVHRHAIEGLDIWYLRRDTRQGFKAGALNEGLKCARGKFVAVFDADFVPPREFLRRMIPLFKDSTVGMVQARWSHINQDYSILTKIQAILLDGHFVVEHGGRHRAGRFFNFNGTAGIWRRDAIESSGGWQHDTLTEDLDLSYRAQLAGWTFIFVQDLEVPAELPVEMDAFKSQQRRWAKGSVQTCRKLLPRLWRSQLPLKIKIEAYFHLLAYLHYVPMLALSLLIVPSVHIRYHMGWHGLLYVDAVLFCVAALSFGYFYAISQYEVHENWKTQLKYLPVLMAVGVPLCFNNIKPILEGLLGGENEFIRTPKYGVERQKDVWLGKRYRKSITLQPFLEVGFGLYFTGFVMYALINGIYIAIPQLLLFQFGFLYTGLVSLVQRNRRG